MQVALERHSTLGLGILWVLLVVVPVAVVPAGAVRRPLSHADPAELVLALLACHVIAAAVLLDGRLALRALLRVGVDPVCGLRVVLALLDPQLDDVADQGLVVLVAAAAEAEFVVAATALDSRDDRVERLGSHPGTSDGMLAIRVRAPSQRRIVVNVASVQQFAVSVHGLVAD